MYNILCTHLVLNNSSQEWVNTGSHEIKWNLATYKEARHALTNSAQNAIMDGADDGIVIQYNLAVRKNNERELFFTENDLMKRYRYEIVGNSGVFA